MTDTNTSSPSSGGGDLAGVAVGVGVGLVLGLAVAATVLAILWHRTDWFQRVVPTRPLHILNTANSFSFERYSS